MEHRKCCWEAIAFLVSELLYQEAHLVSLFRGEVFFSLHLLYCNKTQASVKSKQCYDPGLFSCGLVTSE